jgi:inhibitor of KinA
LTDLSLATPASRDAFPRFRPVGDRALLIEFGEVIEKITHDHVMRLDAALAANPFDGFTEAVPAYTSLLIRFDPLVTDRRAVEAALLTLVAHGAHGTHPGALREIDVCYDDDLAPDLGSVAEARGLTPEQVVETHLSGAYQVFMYGFAPGYAYLAGVPEQIQVPRKQAAIRGIPHGSVLVAGPQCLVTTLTMPSGWWSIGRSPTTILRSDDAERPFLFDVGDRVKFRRISRAEYDASTQA